MCLGTPLVHLAHIRDGLAESRFKFELLQPRGRHPFTLT